MPQVHHQFPVPSWPQLRSAWLPSDACVHAFNALSAGMIVLCWSRIAHGPVYLAFHAVMALLFQYLAKLDAARPREPAGVVTFLHSFAPAPFVLAVYFELGLLIPQIHPFSDYRYDHVLHATDVFLLGDPLTWVNRMSNRLLSDVLSLCYFAYYPFIIVVPVFLYAHGQHTHYQRVTAIILVAFLISFVGYVMFPAIGPHKLFDASRPAALEGYGIAKRGYAAVRDVALEPPDVFPSGHTLFGVLVPALAWRYYRRLFAWVAPIGMGIVLATFYLRFHYLVDILAAIALAPVAWKLGLWVEQRVTGWSSAADALDFAEARFK
jgi:membrane-associated phospholipid phosphatase